MGHIIVMGDINCRTGIQIMISLNKKVASVTKVSSSILSMMLLLPVTSQF